MGDPLGVGAGLHRLAVEHRGDAVGRGEVVIVEVDDEQAVVGWWPSLRRA